MSQEEDAVIDGIGRGQPPRAVSARPPATGPEASAPAETVRVGTDKPAIRETAATLSGIAANLAAKPPVDTAKVERLRAAIVSGDYRANPDAIATAMIALETVPSRA